MSDQIIKDHGECLCGEIKISIEGTPLRMGQCHCRDCQKSSGGGHASLVFMLEKDTKIKGDAAGYDVITDSGNTSTRSFCATCGSRVFGRNTLRPGVIAIAVGILEDRSWYKPQAVVYCKNRNEWDTTNKAIPNFDEMPPPA